MVKREHISASATVAAMPMVVEPQQQPKQGAQQFPDIQTLRDAIPAHCFEPSLWTSFYYVFRDLTMAVTLVWAAMTLIPTFPFALRVVAWTAYGYLQGLVGTGIWILAHECGHGAFSKHSRINDCVGWVLHSSLLVPFFSWKFTHHRHHRFHNHIEKDMVFVPDTLPSPSKTTSRLAAVSGLYEMLEDTPITQLFKLLSHQLFGWWVYLLFNWSAGNSSTQRNTKGLAAWFRRSHFDPHSAIFRPSEALYVLISVIGLAITLTGLYVASQAVGTSTVLLLYAVPYFWVHHWLVAITYLHHTHADLPHYTSEGWTYVKGALATVDRDFGFIGKHIFHGIIDKHVIHHLFPRIPFYKADEATEAIKPILGDLYHHDSRSFLGQLWQVFGTLTYVEHDPANPGALRWAKPEGRKGSVSREDAERPTPRHDMRCDEVVVKATAFSTAAMQF